MPLLGEYREEVEAVIRAELCFSPSMKSLFALVMLTLLKSTELSRDRRVKAEGGKGLGAASNGIAEN